MSKPSPARYRSTNWSSYSASLKKRGSLLIWVDKEMTWLAPHEGSPGRPAVFSDAAIQFCLTIKVLFKLPLRQTTGMVASLLKIADLDWAVPDYTTLCRRQKTLAVQIPYRRAEGPLNLLVDSTGIKFLGDGEWQARKHGVQGRRQWRKVHLAMDTATSDIRAVEFKLAAEASLTTLQAENSSLLAENTTLKAAQTRKASEAAIDAGIAEMRSGLTCLDFLGFIRRVDRSDALFYLDPPYWGCEGDYGKQLFSRERFEELATALRSLKGRFILSLNDVQGVRETFAAFRFQEVKTTYTIGAKGAQPERGEVLISNWDMER